MAGRHACHGTDGTRYGGSFGERASGRPWTEDTVAWLGSMTKMIVAIGALQLIEQGRLSLDVDLGGVLPALTSPQVLEGFNHEGRPVLRAASTPITLRRLLSHTAGNGYHFWNRDIQRYQEVTGLPNIIECREATLAGTPLLFDPGSEWEYGMNMDWVGKAIETVSGQDLERYLRQHVLDPLGMSATSFRITPERRENLSGMNARTPGGLVPIEFEMTQEPEFLMGELLVVPAHLHPTAAFNHDHPLWAVGVPRRREPGQPAVRPAPRPGWPFAHGRRLDRLAIRSHPPGPRWPALGRPLPRTARHFPARWLRLPRAAGNPARTHGIPLRRRVFVPAMSHRSRFLSIRAFPAVATRWL
jgi:CubicO group peptidase (beta-lactamase class C family)